MKAAYLRVSTDEQKKGKTIQGQLHAIQKYLGKEPDKIYKDEGWSGAILQRPQLDELRKDIKEGKVKKLYIYHPDRLSRNQANIYLLLDEFEKAGVKVTFTALPDFFEGSQESQVVMKSTFAMISELERLRISERFRLGRLRKVEEGKVFVGGRSPYGFTYVKGKQTLKHNPHEIRVAKLILNLALEGKSDNEIIKELYKRKIKTRRGNDLWAKSTIHKLLKTNLPVYCGYWYYNKYKQAIPTNPTSKKKYKHTEKTSRVLNPKEEWIKVKLPKHLAIITQEQARLIRKYKRQNKAVKKGNIKHEYLLQGKIYCDGCKNLIYCDCYHQVPYYRCSSKQRSKPFPPKCPGGSIKCETLENAVWKQLTNLITNPELIKKEAEKYIARNSQDTVVTPEIAELVKRKLALKKEKQKLSEGYTKGFIDDEGMAIQSKRIKQEENIILQEELEVASHKQKLKSLDINSLTKDIEQTILSVKDVLNEATFEEKRNILSWLSVKVNYFKYNFAIRGAIPTHPICSPKLHLTHSSRELQEVGRQCWLAPYLEFYPT